MTIKQKQIVEYYIKNQVRKQLNEKRMVYHAEARIILQSIEDIKNEMNIFPDNIKKEIVKLLDKIEIHTKKYGVYDADKE
jgi:hypothetical protein